MKSNTVLAIDASTSPAKAALLGSDSEGNPTLLYRDHIPCRSMEDLVHLDSSLHNRTLDDSEVDTGQPEVPPSSAPHSGSEERSAPNVEGAFFDGDALRAFLARLPEEWSNSILILPPLNYFSFNVDLPLRDRKTMRSLVEIQAQDIVPFDTSEFFLGIHPYEKSGSKLADIHVAGMPRHFIRQVLNECRAVGFEPITVTTPTTVLAGVFNLLSESPESDIAVTLMGDSFSSVLCWVNGAPRLDRIILNGIPEREKLSQITLAVLACEQRYETRIHKILALCHSPKTLGDLTTLLGPERSVVPVGVGENSSERDWLLVRLACLCLNEQSPCPLLTNLRSGEFSYSPQIKEILRGAGLVFPFAAIAMLVTALALVFVYTARNYRIASLEHLIQQQIRATVPDLVSSEGNEVQALQIEMRRLSDELNEMGSPIKLAPGEALLEIARDLKSVPSVTLKRVRIQGTRVYLSGNAPDYSAVEQLERVMKRRREVYCRVKKDTTSTGNSPNEKRPFTLEVILCE